MENDDLLKRIMEEETIPEGHKSGFVALVGRPNVGKSTLMNGFMRQKVAIATPRPQTTRSRQLGILTEPNYQIIFIDTPGIMKPRHKLDEFMVETAVDSLDDADVVLWLVDGGSRPGEGDRQIASQLAKLPKERKVIIGINKADTIKAEDVIERSEAYQALLPNADWILFSALEPSGRDELFGMLLVAIPEGPRYYPIDQITDSYIRDIAAEMIREQTLLHLENEIPYGIAVKITDFKERKNGSAYIEATIFVERDSHKKIIIGTKGAMLRKIGTGARHEIERLIDNKVFTELWVKVAPKWRRNERDLKRFGYASD